MTTKSDDTIWIKTTVQPEVYIDTHKNTEIDETIWI